MTKATNKKTMTAEEIMTILENDHEYQSRIAEKDRLIQESIRINLADYEPLKKQLDEAGFGKLSLNDLFQQKYDKGAIGILSEWIPIIKNKDIKDTLISAVGRKDAPREIIKLLIDEFVKECENEDIDIGWRIGDSIYNLSNRATTQDIERILNIVLEKKYGRSREMLVMALGRIRDTRVAAVLIKLLDDEEVNGHAIHALGRLKEKAAYERIKKFLKHSNSWKRNEAKKAILKIEEQINK